MFSLLYVDDEPGLLEIGKLFLETTGEFSVTIALSGKDALGQLALHDFDAVVSDYQMPEMDGLGLLKSVRKSFGNIPFILFTGKGREEIVIEAINNGVDFYLQKGGDPRAQFAELAHKVRQAVSRRRAELALSNSEKRLTDLINFLPDATFAIDTNGNVITWNRAIEEMTGIPAADMLGKGNYEYALPFYGTRRPILIDLIFEPDGKIAGYYSNILRDGHTLSAETDLPRPKGQQIHVLAKASPLYNREGRITGAIETIRDITDRKKAEEELLAANEQLAASGEELRAQYDELAAGEKRIRESEARLSFMIGFYEYAKKSERELLKYAVEGAGIVTGSPLGYLAFLNADESELSMYAWSEAAMAECSIRDKPLVYKTDKTGLWGEPVRQRQPVITNNYSAPDPKKRGYPEGHPRILRHMGVPVFDEGRIVLVAGVANKTSDYTDNDAHELELLMRGLWSIIKRKHAENDKQAAYEQVAAAEKELRSRYDELATAQGELRSRKEQLEEIAATVPGVVYQFGIKPDGTSHLYFVSLSAAEKIFGFDHTDDDLFRWMTNHVHPGDRARFTESIDEVVRKRTGWNFEGRMVKPSGETIWFQGISNPVARDSELIFTGVLLDITVRKNTETALFESEEKYRTLVEHTRDGVFIAQDSRLVYYNRAFSEMIGYEEQQLIGRQISDFIAPEDREMVVSRHQDRVGGGQVPESYEFSLLRKDGGTCVRVSMQVGLGTYQGQATIGTIHDVTEDRRREGALRESEDRFRRLLAGFFDAIVVHQDGRIVLANERAARIIGAAAPGDLIGTTLLDLVHPDFRASVVARVNEMGQSPGGTVPAMEESFIRMDGTTVEVEVMATATMHEGRPAIMVVFRDLTDKKQTRIALDLLHQHDLEALRVARLGYFEFDVDTRTFVFNDQYYELIGSDVTEIGGYRISAEDFACRFAPPEDADRIFGTIQKAIDTDNPDYQTRFESVFIRPDGARMWMDVWFRIKKDASGRTKTFYGVNQDITDRKAMEEKLRESEEKYRLIAENSPDMIYFIDPEGCLRYLNAFAARAMMTEPDRTIGKHLTDVFRPEVAQHHLDVISHVISTLKPHRDEMFEDLPSGGVWIDVRLSPMVDESGRVLGVLGLSHDISDRKRAEAALRESETKYRMLVENSHDIIYTISADGIMTFVSPSWTTLLGHDPAYVTGKPFQHFVHPADVPECEAFLAKVVSTRQRQEGVEYRVVHADGSTRIHTSTISPIFDDKGSIISYIGNARDITEMKQFQNAIRESNRKLNLLSSITRHDVANQLTVVQGYTQLAALRKTDVVTADFLAKIASAVDMIQHQIEFTRTYQDLGAQAPAWHRIGDAIRSVQPLGIELVCTCDSMEIFADPMIAKVFFNLFDNAVKYGKRVTTITVGCEPAGDELVITFADNGIGIPLDEKQKIFEKGYGQHTGFGLFLAREILAITGISIHETGSCGRGARFEIAVPKGAYRSA